MAAVDYFLKIDTIDGESKDAGYPKWIQLESWSWGETNSGHMGSGTGGHSAGKVSMQDFHFVAGMSTASPSVSLGCATGTHYTSAQLVCRKAGKTPQVFLKIKLTDVLVSSYQTGGSAHSELIPTDQVSLTYSKINIEYGAQDDKGTVNALDKKMGYDLAANKNL